MSFPFRAKVRPDTFSRLVEHLRSVVERFPDSSSPIKFRQKKPNAMKMNGIQEMSEAQCLATEAAA